MQISQLFTKLAIVFIFSIWLTACGGSGSDSVSTETKTDCVIGTSTIGNCKI